MAVNIFVKTINFAEMVIKKRTFYIIFLCATCLNSYGQLPVKDTLHLKHLLVFPVIARSIETDWSFGVASSATIRLFTKDTTARTSNMQVLGLYTLKKQLVAALNGTEYFRHEKYVLSEQISYSSFPDKFWGLGQHTSDTMEEPYSFKQFYSFFHLMRKVAPNVFGGLMFQFQDVMDVNYNQGGLFDKEFIAGKEGYIVSGLGLSLTYDSRNDAFSPDRGNFIQANFTTYDNLIGSKYNFTNWVIDARKYLRIYKHQVLALQGYWSANEGQRIPIRSLSALGGSNIMRGYYSGRYRDVDLYALQGEYRVPLYKRWGIVGFGGVGNVCKSVKDMTIDNKYTYGGGLRFALNKNEKLNLRIDYGFNSDHTSGLYFLIGEAF